MSDGRRMSWSGYACITIALVTYAWAFFLGWSAGVGVISVGLIFSAAVQWWLS